jgi:two-component system, NtrC family, nitrogen regulation sensor histidine kinase GlnL
MEHATRSPSPPIDENAILNALPLPILIVGVDDLIIYGNPASEVFFETGFKVLRRLLLAEILPLGSPVLTLVGEVRRRGAGMTEYRIEIRTHRDEMEHIVDVFASPLRENRHEVLLLLQERTIADKMESQLTHRGAARSLTALGAVLAHEIKNPLSGIKGAAQLLEQGADENGRMLTRLICDETDRIVKLVERMELFGDERPVIREPINVHDVFEHVKRLALSGFARHIRFSETYDPSLPPVLANRDQLVQVLLNLLKNAAESIGTDTPDGEIILSTAYRPGIRMIIPGSRQRVSLPIELAVRDNGPGIAPEFVKSIFDPFVTTKVQGSGLGLALTAKTINDHGGIIECHSAVRFTTFRILMPVCHVREDVTVPN